VAVSQPGHGRINTSEQYCLGSVIRLAVAKSPCPRSGGSGWDNYAIQRLLRHKKWYLRLCPLTYLLSEKPSLPSGTILTRHKEAMVSHS